jgi:hypothetical protein
MTAMSARISALWALTMLYSTHGMIFNIELADNVMRAGSFVSAAALPQNSFCTAKPPMEDRCQIQKGRIKPMLPQFAIQFAIQRSRTYLCYIWKDVVWLKALLFYLSVVSIARPFWTWLAVVRCQ